MSPDFIMQHAIDKSELSNVRRAESEIENMSFACGYAEPGYTDPAKGVLFADWNPFDSKLVDILERYGYSCEWSDEWATCESCNRAIRTSPDSYGWHPSYVILHDCEIICVKCLKSNDSDIMEYLESLENSTRNALNIDINPAHYGYTRLEYSFENGFYPGQTDDPKEITTKLRVDGESRPLLFKIDSTGQFDTHFSVWAKTQ